VSIELAKDHVRARWLFGIAGPTAVVQFDRGVVRELPLVKDDVDAAWTDAHALACTGPGPTAIDEEMVPTAHHEAARRHLA
jgi:hypothetical protein